MLKPTELELNKIENLVAWSIFEGWVDQNFLWSNKGNRITEGQ